MSLYRSDKLPGADGDHKKDKPKEDVDRPTQTPVQETTTVNNRYTPITTLLTHIEGYSWVVNYYHQVLGEDDEPRGHETQLDPVNQQYHQIQDFEIKVTDPLSFRYEQARRTDDYEGEGVIYPGTITPHIGDVFLADIGDGRTGLFAINEIEPMSIFMERCFQIRYQLQDQLNDKLYSDLKSKVVKKSHFIKDFLKSGRDPLLEQDEVVRARYLHDQTEAIFDLFLKRFINEQYRYLLVPGQERPTFDVFISNFLSRIRDVSQYRLMQRCNWPRIEQIDRDQTTTVLDLLVSEHPQPSKLYTPIIEKKMILTNTWAIKQAPFFANLYYSQIQRLVWPQSQHAQVSYYGFPHADPYPYWNPFRTYHAGDIVRYIGKDQRIGYYILQTEFVDTETQDPVNSPLWEFIGHSPDQFQDHGIQPYDEANTFDDNDGGWDRLFYEADYDDYYIFSQHFYEDNKAEQSRIEQMAHLLLQREAIPAKEVVDLIEKAADWRKLDQFYYIPILLVFSDYCLNRGFFTGALGRGDL